MPDEVELLMQEVAIELLRARGLHPPQHSAHEMCSISNSRRSDMRKELIQIAAMALRAILDLDLELTEK